jgi:hypothetical protein
MRIFVNPIALKTRIFLVFEYRLATCWLKREEAEEHNDADDGIKISG